MFKLFGKKKAKPAQETPAPAPQPPAPEKDPKVAALVAAFGSDEFDLMAVTGPNSFRAFKLPKDTFWHSSLTLTAWKEADGDVVQQEAQLEALADQKLLEHLRRCAPRDAIIQVTVRKALKGNRFLLVGLPTPAMEPELKAILDEQVKEVTITVPDLATFTLNRSLGWFQADVEWMGQSAQLTFDQGTQEKLSAAQAVAVALMSDQEQWNRRVHDLAVSKLLSLANDWADDDQEEDAQEGDEPLISADEFSKRMELESIEVSADGKFEFWFNDGDLFLGHSIHVWGTVTDGPTNAQMEG